MKNSECLLLLRPRENKESPFSLQLPLKSSCYRDAISLKRQLRIYNEDLGLPYCTMSELALMTLTGKSYNAFAHMRLNLNSSPMRLIYASPMPGLEMFS